MSPKLPRRQRSGLSFLGGVLDSLLQTFENCRPGLTDDILRWGESAVKKYFTEIYEREWPRLKEAVCSAKPHLTEATADAFLSELDGLIRRVVIPAYAREAFRFSNGERNDFYLLREGLHGAERVGWCVAGILVGSFVVWAPFIPLWSKEWILPFALGGLFFPDLRRYWANRRYEKKVNNIISRAEDELTRIDMAYLLSAEAAVDASVTPQSIEPESVPPKLDKGRVH